MPSLAIVVVSYNTAALLRKCLTAIQDKTADRAAEVIVVDNNSTDGSVAMVQTEFPRVRLIAQPINAGFGAANNTGVAATTADTIMLLNSDAILLTDTAAGLMAYLAANPGVVCASPRVVLPSGTRQPRVFGNLPSLWRIAMQSLNLGALLPRQALFEGVDGRERPGRERRVGWVSGVCMVMRRQAFLDAGGFDPAIFMYCEDVDLCARLAQRGGTIMRVDDFPVRHYGGASSPLMAAQLRNVVWAQRNLLKIVQQRSGGGAVAVARVLLSLGLLLRMAAGLAVVPARGVRGNLLLRSSWVRMLDVAGASALAAG